MIIGPSEYSKDPSLMPEGIVLTLPVMFFKDRGMTTDEFKKYFEAFMEDEDALWRFRLTNLPTKYKVIYVYLLFDKHIQYRLNLVQYERNVSKSFSDSPGGSVYDFPNANWVIMCGPVVKPSKPFPQKGHQGPRYSIKLF